MDPATFTGTAGAQEVLELLAHHDFSVTGPERVTRTLLDTFDGLLRSAGLELEAVQRTARENEKAAEPQLRLADDGSVAMLSVAAAPRFANELPAGPFRSRLEYAAQGRALLPVVTVTAQQRTALQHNGSGKRLASVIICEDIAVRGGHALNLWTAELHSITGHPEPAAKVLDLFDRLALRQCAGSTLRTVAQAAGISVEGFRSSPTIPLSKDMTAFDGYRAVFSHHAETLGANWQGAVDDIDAEFLHDARVAIRRTRSVLKYSKDVLSVMQRRRFSDGFAWLGRVTSPARDLDVYVLEWDTYVASLPPNVRADLRPVLASLSKQRRDAHNALRLAFTAPHAQGIVSAWNTWLHAHGEAGGPAADAPLAQVVEERIARAQRQLLRHGRAIGPTTPPERLHDLRKEAKKLRYLLESFGGLYEPAARKAFVKRLRRLQENLGSFQDAATHIERLESMAPAMGSSGPAVLLAIGRLLEQLELQRTAAREEFAERFAEYDSKPTRSSLKELLQT